MATNPRRVASKKPARPVKRIVPKQEPAPEVEAEETNELEEEVEIHSADSAPEEEVPESIRQVVQDAMDATRDDDLESMPVLTIEMIRDARDRTTQWLPVPEWGGKMQIKSLSADAMFGMMDDDSAGITETGIKMDLSVTSMQKQIIQNGVVQPVITDAGFQILMEKSTAPVMKIMNAIMKISKMGSNENGESSVDNEVKTFRPTGEQ